MIEHAPDLARDAFGVTRGSALPGQLFQRLLRRQFRIDPLLGVLVGELIKGEAAALGDLNGSSERLRIPFEMPVHLLGWLEIAIGMPLPALTQFVDRAAVPYAGDYILQHAPRRYMEQHIIGDDRWHP